MTRRSEVTPDEVLKHYASELRKIYDERTAGDYTFEGVLAEFKLAMDESSGTVEVTPSMRFTVSNHKYNLRSQGKYTEAYELECVQNAESFPNSYTNTAVELSRRVIVKIASSSLIDARPLLDEVKALVEGGQWVRKLTNS